MRGLERASELAPFDLDLRLNLAAYQLRTRDLAAARGNLLPIAYHPHAPRGVTDAAREVIDWIDAGGEAEPPTMAALLLRTGRPTEAAEEPAAAAEEPAAQ